MANKRKFTRVGYNNKAFIIINNTLIIDVNILNISLGGALLEIVDDFIFWNYDKWHFTFRLPNSDKSLLFKIEVVHSHVKQLGVKFVHVDVDTKAHLLPLIKAIPHSQKLIVNGSSI